jgi:hypothetical protein
MTGMPPRHMPELALAASWAGRGCPAPANPMTASRRTTTMLGAPRSALAPPPSRPRRQHGPADLA